MCSCGVLIIFCVGVGTERARGGGGGISIRSRASCLLLRLRRLLGVEGLRLLRGCVPSQSTLLRSVWFASKCLLRPHSLFWHQCGSSLPLLSQYSYFLSRSFDFRSCFCSHVSLSFLHFSNSRPNLPRRPLFLFCRFFSAVLLVFLRGGGLLLPSIRKSFADIGFDAGVH